MGVLQPAVGSHAVPVKSHRSRGIFEAGWDLRRFAALAHHDFSTFSSGGPALETSWSPPYIENADCPGEIFGTRANSNYCGYHAAEYFLAMASNLSEQKGTRSSPYLDGHAKTFLLDITGWIPGVGTWVWWL